MKKKLSVFLSLLLALSMLLPMAVMPVFAEGEEASDTYEAPESPAITYNMNLDWKFYDTKDNAKGIQQLISETKDSAGHMFYEKDFNDSSWETVSIPHAPGGLKAFDGANQDAGGGYRSVLFYRKHFTIPADTPDGSKIFFELEGIRQAAYLWVNGQKVGYYEAGITAMGFDITNYVTPGQEAVIAICNDGLTARGTEARIPYETIPGDEWGSSYTPDNYKHTSKDVVGAQYQWNTKDFNEPVIGLVYDAYLHIKGNVYQTLPLYNNLKTTGNYIYAKNFNISGNSATVGVKAEVRNESGAAGNYTLDVVGVDHEGKKAFEFSSAWAAVAEADDVVTAANKTPYETAVEDDVYTGGDAGNLDYNYTLTDKEKIIAATEKFITASDSNGRVLDVSTLDKYDLKETGKGSRLTYSTYDADGTAVTGSSDLPDRDEATGNLYVYFYTVGDKEYEINKKNKKDGKNIATKADADKRYTRYVQATVHNEINVTKINTPKVTYITAEQMVENLRFWSLDDPYLYTVYTILKDSEGKAVDVQSTKTGFREIKYDSTNGILVNGSPVWLRGYAQRSTNEWAVIGLGPDWLQDYDMSLLKSNNSNFIRWMHVAPKPNEVRSSDKYGVAVVVPAGDKEGTAPNGRQWTQRTEAMRDAMIYFRNSPSVFFYETGNSPTGVDEKSNEMYKLRQALDPDGMRFIGARSTNSADQLNYDWNYAGTMYGSYASDAINAMKANSKMGPIMETEYARDESPRRVWDNYSPPDFDYVNKYISSGGKKDNYDVWDLTQEEITVKNVKEYSDGYYSQRMGSGTNVYSAAAMMVWSDSNMHTRNCASENDRTSGRVDAVRQTKEMYEGTKTAQAEEAEVHIIGHWNYPKKEGDNYKYYGTVQTVIDGSHKYEKFNMSDEKWRDPTTKTVYVIGSAQVSQVKLFRIDKQSDGTEKETPIGYADGSSEAGIDKKATSNFIYQFDNVDVTQGDGVIARAYDAMGTEYKDAAHKIYRAGDPVGITYTVNKAPGGWRGDGADIAYIDLKVVDANGNTCPLYYDKISFTNAAGDGVLLGGYNSGNGAGIDQMHSKYFGGTDSAISTIGKDYVWAENGTARIFVRSTKLAADKEEGEFSFTVSTGSVPSQSIAIKSVAIENANGLTTVMSDELAPGVKADAGSSSGMSAMYPLMNKKWNVSWNEAAKVTKEVYVDPYEGKYYDLQYNGASLGLTGASRARLGTMDKVFGPVLAIMEKLSTDGALTYTYDNGTLVFTPKGSTADYTVKVASNFIESTAIDGGKTEIVQDPEIVGDELFVSLAAVLGYAGASVSQDDTNKVVNVTYTAQ